MSEAKKLWTGTWMGIDAHVEVIGGAPVAFLSGRRAHFEGDVRGILGATVVGLAAEGERWQCASGCVNPETISAVIADFYKRAECRPPLGGIPDGIDRIKAERDALRDRLALIQSTDNQNLDARAEALADVFAGKNVDGCHATESEIDAVRKTLAYCAKKETDLRDRLAKLEAALDHALNHLGDANNALEAEVGDDDEDVRATRLWIETTRSEVWKGTANGEASKI